MVIGYRIINAYLVQKGASYKLFRVYIKSILQMILFEEALNKKIHR